MIDSMVEEKVRALSLNTSLELKGAMETIGNICREVLAEICDKGWFVGTFVTACDDQATGQGSMGLVKSLTLEGNDLKVHGNAGLWGYQESFTYIISLADHRTRLFVGDKANPLIDTHEGDVKIIGTSSNGHTAEWTFVLSCVLRDRGVHS